MHIKEKPNDFHVEEITHCPLEVDGPFAVYRLEKRGWTTPDAIAIIRRRWKIEPRRISFGGLKDRHANTIQYLSIFHGPKRKLTHTNLQLTYVGQAREAYESHHIEANRFAVTVRGMTEVQVVAAYRALEEVRAGGVPNYYDDQRFGSVAEGSEFVARQIILGEYEAALQNALTAPYAFERAAQKKEKGVLRRHWGDWRTCRKLLPRHAIVEHLLAHAGDFRGALERLPPELRTLFLSAYQSFLWNRMLADWVIDQVPATEVIAVPVRLGELPMPRRLNPEVLAEFREVSLPLHSARNHLDETDPRKRYFDQILKEEGLELEQFKLKGFRALFFSKGERAAWCVPRDLEARDAMDEEHPRKRKLTLRFELPRGCYATLVVKRVTRVDAGIEI